MIKLAYSVSFLLSINIFVWQNVLYFPNDLRARARVCMYMYIYIYIYIYIYTYIYIYIHTQGGSAGRVTILGGNRLGHSEKQLYVNMCLILNGYRYRDVFDFPDLTSLHFVCGVGWRAKFTKKRWTHAATRIRKREDQLRRKKKRDLHT